MGCAPPKALSSLPPRIIDRILFPPIPDSECWLWRGYVMKTGYGRTRLRGKKALAHRAVYEWLVGTIPEGLTLDHLCRVRRCVNPAHLEPVSGYENFRRGESFGAKNLRKPACPKCGGPLERLARLSGRRCRSCTRAYSRVYARARRAANPGADAAYQRARYAKKKLARNTDDL